MTTYLAIASLGLVGLGLLLASVMFAEFGKRFVEHDRELANMRLDLARLKVEMLQTPPAGVPVELPENVVVLADRRPVIGDYWDGAS
jgi:hypothetical protein